MTEDNKKTSISDSSASSQVEPEPASASSPRVVGIGASAGGLQAFTDFLRAMPVDSGLAFVLVQHLDPQQPSMLPELLASHTRMAVRPVTDRMPVAPNEVYLIPPNRALTIAQGVLCLEPPTEAHGHRLPINHFLRSLAEDQGAHAVGIVLTGTGTDGAEGLTAIKACGGLTLVQEPTSAAYPSMPEAAIAQGAAIYIVTIAEMPALILVGGAAAVALPSAPASLATLSAIITLLQQITGHDFSHYKTTTLQRRVAGRMQQLGLASIESYLERLKTDRTEAERLFQHLLIGVTEFFRDLAAFDALVSMVFSVLLRGKQAGQPVRVWVPGCASGEEAYSLAIILREQLAQLDVPLPVQIFATDIDEVALAVARRGHYDAGIAAHIAPERLARYFTPDGMGYQVAKELRELCLFSVHNLISDPPFGRMDLIACRNLLIYFDTELQRQLIPVFHYALAPGGYLFLGSAETIAATPSAAELFRVVDGRYRIYQRKERMAHPQITLPWASARRPPARIVGASPRQNLSPQGSFGATIDQILLQDYAPTAVVIDAQGSIIYVSGRAHPFLSVPEGVPTSNLFDIAHPGLRLHLRAAARAAVQAAVPVVREDLILLVDAEQIHLTLSVRPFPDTSTERALFLVIMQAHGPATARTPLIVQEPAAPGVSDGILALELQRTRDTLETTIDELQEANLDLTAANEELRSLNEELHATNEELQTSKEEIQSINEELQTVNAELGRKIEELDRANADLANLFASVQIPAIFLHPDSRISRFTPQATELFALIDSDLDRPLADLSARFIGADLPPLIAQVQATLDSVETLLHQPEQDRWWSMRIRPYRTLANLISGTVLTFTDISTLKRAELALQKAHDQMEQRVNERTNELAASNAALQIQLAEGIRVELARQQLLQQLVTAQEEERRHIARELHDQLGQDLAALILGLRALQEKIADDTSAARVVQLLAIAIGISQDVRDLAVQMRPSVLDDLGLNLTLRNYVEQWSARASVAVDLHTSGLEERHLPLAVETTIYRLIQESLTNILKHAQASEVSVIIECHASEVSIIIEDDGIGFVVPARWEDLADAKQFGLIGMRERVMLLGGTLVIESAPGSSTSIFVHLPLPTIEGEGGPDGNHQRGSG